MFFRIYQGCINLIGTVLLLLSLLNPVPVYGFSDSFMISVIADPYAPDSVIGLVAATGNSTGEIILNWTAPGDDGDTGQLFSNIYPDYSPFVYEIKLSFEPPDDFGGYTTSWWSLASSEYSVFMSDALLPGEVEEKTLNGLIPATTYWVGLRARDKVGNWSADLNVVQAVSEGFSQINDLVAATNNIQDGRIDLTWTSVGGDLYIVKYDRKSIDQLGGTAESWWGSASETYSQQWSPKEYGSNEIHLIIDGLRAGSKYYISIRAERSGVLSPIGNISNAKSGRDKMIPKAPSGIHAEFNFSANAIKSNSSKITIKWNEVSRNTDNSNANDMIGYNIYGASSINGSYELKAFVPSGTSSWTDPENIDSRTNYYFLRTLEYAGDESLDSMTINTLGQVFACGQNDRATYISIPPDLNRKLYNDNFIIDLQRVESEEFGQIIKSYEFKAVKFDNSEIVRNYVFDKPDVRVVMSYDVVEGQVMGSKSLSADRAKDNLAIFWYNGVEWIKFGGTVDEINHSVEIKTKRLGKYMVKESKRASSFAVIDNQPDKIFTPNNDGWNDYFELICANPFDGKVSGEIYNLDGSFVAEMEVIENLSGGSVSFIWDGARDDGKAAHGGVYIYQVEVSGPENKVLNGTLVIAR